MKKILFIIVGILGCVPILLFGLSLLATQGLAAGSLFVTSGGYGAGPACVLRYDADTGVFISVFTSGGDLGTATGLTFGPDGHLYVSDRATHRVLRYDGATGAFLDVFASGGGLLNPQGLVFGPDGNLYVVGQMNHAVLRYDGVTGDFIDIFAIGGMVQPRGVIFGPDGNMYVANTASSNVLRFNGTTGDFIDMFVPPSGLVSPIGMEFGADGNFYVTSYSFPSSVRKYDGTTGGFIARFDDPAGGLVDPIDLGFGLDGNLYVASYTDDAVLRFDGATGAFLDVFASGSGLVGPQFLAFRGDMYVFNGFDKPVDNLPIVNRAKAGSTIPIKWRITDTYGSPISDPASFQSLKSYSVACETLSGHLDGELEEYSAGGSGLQYLGDGYWQFNWKTAKGYAGQCRVIVLRLADGSTHTASFAFK